MAGFADILGSMVQSGLSQSGGTRLSNAFGTGNGSGGLQDIMGSLGQMMGNSQSQQSGGGMLGSMLGSMLGGGQSSAGGNSMGGMMGELLNNLGSNKTALGGIGALAGALLGGGGGATRGAVGGGALAVIASLAISALKNAGQQPAKTPAAFYQEPTAAQQQEMDVEAEIIVKAMISAAKADGKIDQNELQRIIGKLGDNGLTEEEKAFFQSEVQTPVDINKIAASALGRPELAAQIYAASLLAIEVDTPGEQQYMQNLATTLGLAPEVVHHIETTLAK